jgi:hypothetical protein
LEKPPNFGEPAAPFDGPLKARKRLADSRFEEWLYTPDEGEEVEEETEQQALEAKWAEEDLKLRLQTAGCVAIPVLFIGMGIVSLFTTSWTVTVPFMWMFTNIPLLTFAVITWRRREWRLGLKRPVKGRKARILAVLAVLFSLISFLLFIAKAMMYG